MVYPVRTISINRNRMKNIVMIFRIDLVGSFSLKPSTRNKIPLITRPISAIQINFPAPGQCIILNREPNKTTAIVIDEKMILNFSRPDVRFPIKELMIRIAVRTPTITPAINMACAPNQCWLLNIIPLVISMLETRVLILIILIMAVLNMLI